MARLALPEEYQKQIQPGLAVEWWGRRAFYEVIEELSDSIWWAWILCSLVHGCYLLTEDPNILFGLLFCIYPALHFILELLRWRDEIYVVCRNDDRGGGMLYKFWGTWSTRHVEDAIDAGSPAVTSYRPWNIRLWGWLTGEHMEKVHISSKNNTYIDGRRVPPGFIRAIRRVRGAQAVSKEQDMPEAIAGMRELDRARSTSLLPDYEARQLASVLAQRLVWGE